MEGEAIAARERERSRRGGVFDAGREMRPSFTGGEAEQPLPWDVPAAEGRGGPVSAPQAGEAAEGRYRDLPAGTTRSRLALYLYPEAASSAAASKRLSAAILADRGLFMGLLRLGWSPRRRTFTKAQKELVIDALGVK